VAGVGCGTSSTGAPEGSHASINPSASGLRTAGHDGAFIDQCEPVWSDFAVVTQALTLSKSSARPSRTRSGKGGIYHDVPELIAAIETFIEGHNRCAQPFLWTKTAEDILIKAAEQQPTSETLH